MTYLKHVTETSTEPSAPPERWKIALEICAERNLDGNLTIGNHHSLHTVHLTALCTVHLGARNKRALSFLCLTAIGWSGCVCSRYGFNEVVFPLAFHSAHHLTFVEALKTLLVLEQQYHHLVLCRPTSSLCAIKQSTTFPQIQHNVKCYFWKWSCMSTEILLLFHITVVMTNGCKNDLTDLLPPLRSVCHM